VDYTAVSKNPQNVFSLTSTGPGMCNLACPMAVFLIPNATSPYSNPISGGQQFFRLI